MNNPEGISPIALRRATKMLKDSITFLSIQDVVKKTSLARSTIYSKIAKGDLPAPVRISDRASRFIESEIDEWCRSKIEQSRGSSLKEGERNE